MKLVKKYTGIGALLISLIALGVIAHLNDRNDEKIEATSFSSPTSTLQSAPVGSGVEDIMAQKNVNPSQLVKIDDQYPVNLRDDKILMGASHDVFVAKVLSEVGDKQRFAAPETQFGVEIVYNIKGNLTSTVTVDQEGGYENGVLYYVEDGTPLLQPGSTYLLATRYDAKDGWYLITSFSSAWKLLSQGVDLTTTQLQALAQNDQRVKQLEAAYPNEILLSADIAHHNALNSYQSLHPQLPPPSPAPSSTVMASSTASSTGL